MSELHSMLRYILLFSLISWVSTQKYKVTTIMSPPYTMYDKQTGKKTGLIPDILDQMKTILNVEFEVNVVKDNQYGYQLPNGSWTGMIGELKNNEADIAAAPITATALRAAHVDFSFPYMDIGLKILIKKQQTPNTVIESASMFFRPLQTGVWIAIVIAFIVFTFAMYIISRFNPEETNGDDENLPFTTVMFMMFSMLSLQGFRLTPASAGGRILVCFWWFFAITVIAMYTASLSAQLFLSLPAQEKLLPFYTFKDLVNQGSIQYGCVKNGATFYYFNTSNGETEMKIKQYFRSNPQVLVNNQIEGVKRVRDGNYALIMESEAAYYDANQQPCDLTVTGEALGDKDYAFACRNNTDTCSKLNVAIIQLLQSGEMRRLRNKWMDGGCGTYESLAFGQHYTPLTIGDIEAARRVDIQRFTGPLVLLSIGIIIAAIVTGLEIVRTRPNRGSPKGRRIPEDRARIDTPDDAE